jgi:hypothetical protein
LSSELFSLPLVDTPDRGGGWLIAGGGG